jgi:anti-sigma-K factor RskA
MTDVDLPDPDGSDDALAAEYVLGVLDMGERLAAEARLRTDAGFRARVAAWEGRLSGLNADFAPVDPPNLLPAIEARLFPRPTRQRSRWLWFGGAVTAALLAIAAIWPQLPAPAGPTLTAALTDPAQPLSFAATVNERTGSLTLVRTAGDAAGPGQDLQLWVIGAEGTPASLGLIRAPELTLSAPGLTAGLVLAVSLEPEGGSPTGLPTGPVLVTGVLAQE